MALEQQIGGPTGEYCTNCGQALEANTGFCPKCGSGTAPRPPLPRPLEGGAARTDHIKYRNMIMQVILCIVTFGIYAIY